ncbi:MAG: FG-GAP-like repeat-containing protein, partial [Bacteroidia bacterium]|nr:FG-GAP-like repeat-containing protein [Bacteroidia bacterium]
MKVKIQFYFLVLLFFLGYNSFGQVVEVTQSFSSGVQAPVVGSVITAPGQGSNGQINITNTANVQYKARDIVHLKDGFHAGEFTGNGIFHAYIDPSQILPADYSGGLLDDQEFEDREINTSKAVGYIPATYNVTPTGAASYTIPIQVPPGTAGMIPTLSLGYNSQSGNGILGWGWNLSGLSAISRVPKTIYHNGKVEPVKFDGTDNFALDGQMLIKSGNYYYTESESFSKITANISGEDINYFIVESNNGTTIQYGFNLDSKFKKEGTNEILFWLVDKITDNYGNYVSFKYRKVGQEIVIDKILYTGNEEVSLNPYNTIEFYYESRSDKNIVYSAGIPIESSLLLRKIQIIADGQNFKSYTFNYGLNMYSLLKEVKEFGSDESEINSTIFKYGDEQPIFQESQTSVVQNLSIEMFTGDFNGDGFSDILAATKNYAPPEQHGYKYFTDIKVFINNHGSFDQNNPGFAISDDQTAILNNGKYTIERGIIPYYHNTHFGDFNGDGKSDLLVTNFNFECENKFQHLNAKIYNSTGSNFSSPLEIAEDWSENYVAGSNFLVTGDFDGDGATDILTFLGIYQSDMDLCCFPWHCNQEYTEHIVKGKICFPRIGTTQYTISGTDFIPNDITKADYVFVIDFDGDGKQELMVTKESNTKIFSFEKSTNGLINASILYDSGYPTKWHTIYPGDFNGDGTTDFLTNGLAGTNTWHIAYCKGTTGFEEHDFTFDNYFPDSDYKPMVADYNGDGKTDILYNYDISNTGHGYLDVYYSISYNSFERKHSEPTHPISQNDAVLLGDFNSDGNTDEIHRSFYEEPSNIFYFNKNSKGRLLHSAKNGFNIPLNFDYNFLTQSNSYTQGNLQSYPLIEFKYPIPIVVSQWSPNCVGNGNNYAFYEYSGSVLHKNGKGFLGFNSIAARNYPSGMKEITEYEINETNYVSLQKKNSLRLISDNSIISETENTNIVSSIEGTLRYFARCTLTTSNDYLNSFLNQTIQYDYFSDRNIKKITKIKPGVETSYVEYEAYEIHSGKTVPTSIRTYNQRGNSNFSKLTKFSYNNKGLPTEETSFFGLPKSVTTTYDQYDAFGNCKRSNVSSIGLPNKTVKVDFDTKGRFAIKKYNPLNQYEEYTYDSRWGKPLSVKGINGLTTYFYYDGWGKLIKSIDEHGVETNSTTSWALNSGFGNVVFSTITAKPGSPSSTIYFDALSRNLFSIVPGYNGQDILIAQTYDEKGNLKTQTQPYKELETPVVTTYNYDNYNRVSSLSNSAGSTIYDYSATNGINTITVVDPAGQSSSKSIDASGKIVSSTDGGGTLEFTYNALGAPLQTKTGGNSLITMTYDPDFGTQTSLIDLNGGTTSYVYNAYGQLQSQDGPISGNSDLITFDYDVMSRCITKTVGSEETHYEFYETGNGINQLKKATAFDGSYQEISYDIFGNSIQFKEKHGSYSEIFTTSYTYNQYEQLTSTTYPSGFVIKNIFDQNGYLVGIKDAVNHSLFSANTANGKGQLTNYTLGNGKITENTYDQYGYLRRTFTQGIQDLETEFNIQSGNLEIRTDNLKNHSENFNYDILNRLTQSTPSNLNPGTIISDPVNGPYEDAISYSNNGNISSKFGLGNFYYESERPNAVTAVDNNHFGQGSPPLVSTLQQNISYKNDRPIRIAENSYCSRIFYGVDDNRLVSELKQKPENADSILINRRFYSLNYEKLELGNDVYEINYIPGGDGLAAINVKHKPISGEPDESYFYVYKDHLGSIITLTKEEGQVVYEQNFDAWGRRRNAETWAYESNPNILESEGGLLWFNRGFTGHESLTEFSLINMNSRLYDPILGRFLAVDNYVQDATSTQGYNRYSYCMNNPLNRIDPSGDVWFVPIIIAATVGATIGATVGGIQAYNNYGNFWEGAWKGALVGGIGGALGGGFGAAGAAIGVSGVLPGMVYGGITGSITGGITGGLSSSLNGGNFIDGFGNGALWGGIMGGVSGGIGGGVEAYNRGNNIWWGSKVAYHRNQF